MPDTEQSPVSLNSEPEVQENLESESVGLKNSGQKSAPNVSVEAVLDELEHVAKEAEQGAWVGFAAEFTPATALALIEVARRVAKFGCSEDGDHLVYMPGDPSSQGEAVDPEACPVCALGRLTEGRAE